MSESNKAIAEAEQKASDAEAENKKLREQLAAMEKAKEEPESAEVEETNEVSKIVWLKADGRKIKLFDTPELAKKADELGWKKAK